MTNALSVGHYPLYLFPTQADPSHSSVILSSAGRIHTARRHGRVMFFDIWHRGRRVQSAVRRDSPCWEIAMDWSVGDWIQGQGTLATSQTGELTWWLVNAEVVSRPSHPLAGAFEHGRLPEQAWLMAPETLPRAHIRPRLLHGIRTALSEDLFCEVETPILQTAASGAAARPFTTRVRAWDSEAVLRVAPEPALIRMMTGGWDRIFEIGRCFRNEGVSPRHHPEFTLLECYEAFSSLENSLNRLERLLVRGFEAAGVDPGAVAWGEHRLDFTQIRRVRLREAVAQAWETGNEGILMERVSVAMGRPMVSPAEAWLCGFELRVEPTLIQPTAVLEWPAEVSPLAHAPDGAWAERFEVYAAGMELANGYTQEQDAERQRQRFAQQAQAVGEGEDIMPADSDYLDSMTLGMPPLSGFGVGIDRWVMLAMGASHIREGLTMA